MSGSPRNDGGRGDEKPDGAADEREVLENQVDESEDALEDETGNSAGSSGQVTEDDNENDGGKKPAVINDTEEGADNNFPPATSRRPSNPATEDSSHTLTQAAASTAAPFFVPQGLPQQGVHVGGRFVSNEHALSMLAASLHGGQTAPAAAPAATATIAQAGARHGPNQAALNVSLLASLLAPMLQAAHATAAAAAPTAGMTRSNNFNNIQQAAPAPQQQQPSQAHMALQPTAVAPADLPNYLLRQAQQQYQPLQQHPPQQPQVFPSFATSTLHPATASPTATSATTNLNPNIAALWTTSILPLMLQQQQQQQQQQWQQQQPRQLYAPAQHHGHPAISAPLHLQQTYGVSAPQQVATAAASAAGLRLTGRSAVPVYLDFDEEALNEYQCLLRKQIELFETTQSDIEGSAQGRNTPISIGQVGIRCRHCSRLPRSERGKGAMYYSRSLDGLYQVAQNMARVHFSVCPLIPKETKDRLAALQDSSHRASGGKEYWVEGFRAHGVYEDGTGRALRFRPGAL